MASGRLEDVETIPEVFDLGQPVREHRVKPRLSAAMTVTSLQRCRFSRRLRRIKPCREALPAAHSNGTKWSFYQRERRSTRPAGVPGWSV